MSEAKQYSSRQVCVNVLDDMGVFQDIDTRLVAGILLGLQRVMIRLPRVTLTFFLQEIDTFVVAETPVVVTLQRAMWCTTPIHIVHAYR